MFRYSTVANRGWNASYDAMAMLAGPDPQLDNAFAKRGAFTFEGKSRAATFYEHHWLHAWYAAYALSAEKPALIITGDGGGGPSFAGGGVYFWRPPGSMRAVCPVDGWLGEFYTLVSMYLGFDEGGGPGKLMGLAPYGRPVFVDAALIGTRRQVTRDGALKMRGLIEQWFRRHDIDFSKLGDWDKRAAAPPPLVADIAASAQSVLEINIAQLYRAAASIARRAGFEHDSVLLCGGLALNCPANSNLWTMAEKPVLAPPAVNDEGLSIGAAVAAWTEAAARMPAPPADYAAAVYLGSAPGRDDVETAAASRNWRRMNEPADMIAAAVRLLSEGEIVAILSGRSEVGPRALGHRSILADPRNPAIWRRVNDVKKREAWRPFAPAVLHDESAAHFDRGPDFSPYMLFNYRCLTKAFPAVTHFDHTARLQHVARETGLLHSLLSEWSAAGFGPALLNTSFNGPGVPIVETAEDAFSEAEAIGVRLILTDFGLYSAP